MGASQSQQGGEGAQFPKDFAFGVASAACQIEGGYREDGRGASIWDTFCGLDTLGMPGSVWTEETLAQLGTGGLCPANSAIADPARDSLGATTEDATSFRYTYKSDIEFMAKSGIKHFRMSLSWSRIIPTGFLADGVSESGVNFYKDVFKTMRQHGITPLVTLYHWDLPQGLLNAPGPIEHLSKLKFHDETPGYYQGWYSATASATGLPVPRGVNAVVVKEFTNYADFCFKTFTDVKDWSSFNEAWVASKLSSGWGKAPSTAPYLDVNVWPYVAAHNMIIAHAQAGMAIKDKYPKLNYSMVNNCDYQHPVDEANPQNRAIALSLVDAWLGWFMHPVYGIPDGSGGFIHDYPESMRTGPFKLSYLPAFTESEKALLKTSRAALTAIGLNHYGTNLVDAEGNTSNAGKTKMFDNKIPLSYSFENKGIPTAESGWLNMAPWGLRKLLNYIKDTFQPNLPIYITENGCSDGANRGSQGHYDPARVMFYHDYLTEVHKAMTEDGVDVRGYYAWSIFDNYEWEMGYREMFGIMYSDIEYLRSQEEIDRHNKTTRGPKLGEEHPLLHFEGDEKLEIKRQLVSPMIKLPAPSKQKIAKRSFLFLKDSLMGDNRKLANPLAYVSLTQLEDHPFDMINHVPVVGSATPCEPVADDGTTEKLKKEKKGKKSKKVKVTSGKMKGCC